MASINNCHNFANILKGTRGVIARNFLGCTQFCMVARILNLNSCNSPTLGAKLDFCRTSQDLNITSAV